MNAQRIPFIKNDRAIFFTVFGIGLLLCIPGIGKAPVYGWTHPITLLGCALGGVIFLLAGSVLFRKPLGPIATPRQATLVMLGLMAVKYVLAAMYAALP